MLDLEDIWSDATEAHGPYDAVALSTTFICHFPTLRKVVDWIIKRNPHSTLILGGQYSNLKYRSIMERIPEVKYIVKGDGEIAFPKLLYAIEKNQDVSGIRNLVWRNGEAGTFSESEIEYIDFNDYPSPTFLGRQEIIPYESMRGCPYDCKFCSFPSASPIWRYKTADKIIAEWKDYSLLNHVQTIKAMDSTFTVPKNRFRELLDRLPELQIGWEAYARAEAIDSPETVRKLEAAHCKSLSIGFESMSDATLRKMNKGVTSRQNMKAHELLACSDIDYRMSFIIGYPGETPQDYESTHQFIVEKFTGRFLLSVFSLLDETMPVWDDAATFGIEITDQDDPEYSWRHSGMDSVTAFRLWEQTVRQARWNNEEGVMSLWQARYENPLVPGLSVRTNRRIEKLVERLAFLQRDLPKEMCSKYCRSILDELRGYGIVLQ